MPVEYRVSETPFRAMSVGDKSLTPRATGKSGRHVPSSSAAVLRAIVAVAGMMGVRPGRFLSLLGVSAAELQDPEQRISFNLLIRAWELAPTLSKDECFGLHFGELVPAGAFDTMDYATKSCSSLGEAFERLVRYQRLVHSVGAVSLERGKESARLALGIHHRAVPGLAQSVEATLSLYVMRSRALTDTAIVPLEVAFAHAAPADTSEHARVFGCEPRFGATRNQLTFRARDLDRPLVGADTTLLHILERQAETALARLPPRCEIAERVAQAVAGAIDGEVPRLSSIARKLGIGARSLQRKLAAAGTSYSAVVDEVRSELARDYLVQSDLGFGEIAYRLGFSEQSAFYRAFRRWTETTPRAYRNGTRRVCHLA